jgi:hypothetical protein
MPFPVQLERPSVGSVSASRVSEREESAMKQAWKFRSTLVMGFTALIVSIIGFHRNGNTQTTSSGQSDYIFRFNTGISSVFLANMTFPSQQQINLGSCTATEQINGPIYCAVNCSNDSVCLLSLTGPSGSTVNDVLQLVSETPSTGASPSPVPSAIASSLGLQSKMFKSSPDSTMSLNKRIEAYNAIQK